MSLLDSAGLKGACTVTNIESRGTRTIRCEGGIAFSINDSTLGVESLSFRPRNQVRADDLLTAYGEPSLLLVVQEGRPDHPLMTMRLVYEELNAIVLLSQMDGTRSLLSPDSPLLSVSYSESSIFQDFLSLNSDLLVDWQGYGPYSEDDSPT
jgi:hypothetical protein